MRRRSFTCLHVPHANRDSVMVLSGDCHLSYMNKVQPRSGSPTPTLRAWYAMQCLRQIPAPSIRSALMCYPDRLPASLKVRLARICKVRNYLGGSVWTIILWPTEAERVAWSITCNPKLPGLARPFSSAAINALLKSVRCLRANEALSHGSKENKHKSSRK